MRIRFRWFALGLLVFAGFLLFLSLPNSVLSSEQIIGLSAFVVLAVLAEGQSLKLPFGNAYLGLSGTIFWALFILFEPFWSAICAFLALIIVQSIVKNQNPYKAIFNATQTTISILAGAWVFYLVSEGRGLSIDGKFALAFSAGALTYWFANTWLVSFGAKALYDESPIRFWNRNFRWAFTYELMSAPIAIIVAYAYQELFIVGLLLVTLPILMVKHAYSQYIELKKTYRETVRTLVKIIEMHDPYTAGHSDRVARYSRLMCEALQLNPTSTEKIELAAYLHDLGKINLDLTDIVKKAAKLTEEERRLIRLHPVVSADLANQVSYFKGDIEAMIRHHHENWDGSGYPHGLSREEIPLGSRIILLADAFDAMTTSRVYRDALDLEEVKREFRKFSGIQFDPNLVPVFLEDVLGDGENVIRPPIEEPIEELRAISESGAETELHSIADMR